MSQLSGIVSAINRDFLCEKKIADTCKGKRHLLKIAYLFRNSYYRLVSCKRLV